MVTYLFIQHGFLTGTEKKGGRQIDKRVYVPSSSYKSKEDN